jgi:hypothetical protein
MSAQSVSPGPRGPSAHRLDPWGSCRALRGLRATAGSPTTPAPTGIAPSARARRRRTGLPPARPTCRRSPSSIWSSRCRPQIAPIAYHNKPLVDDLLFRTAAEALLTIAPTGQACGLKARDPKHLSARIGATAVLHSWGSAMTHHPHVPYDCTGGGLPPRRPRAVSSDGDVVQIITIPAERQRWPDSLP